jgi:hypothetical protein
MGSEADPDAKEPTMKVLVVYESMYGNTHTIAEAIGRGCGDGDDVQVVPVGDATPERLQAADVVLVGGPTHLHGESWSMTRAGARSAAAKDEDLELDPDAEGPGLRTWFHGLGTVDGVRAAAFDTRVDANPTVTGRASKGIARKLRHHGFDLIAEPESFLVTGDSVLMEGEDERAEAWARSVLGAATVRE